MVGELALRDLRACFFCDNLLVVRSNEDVPVAKFKTFTVRPPSYHGEQKRYPVLFELAVCQADNPPRGGSSIGDTVFVCESCCAKKGFRRRMAEIFMAKLRSRSVSLVHELFDSNIISVGPSSAARLKGLKTENLAGILGALQREQKNEVVPELIFALFGNGGNYFQHPRERDF